MASFAYALYADVPVQLVPSSDYATGWSVRVPDPDVLVLPQRRSRPSDYEPLVREAVRGRDRVWFLSSHDGSDVYEIQRQLRDLGFSRRSAELREGAFLDLWVRGPGAPPDAA
jgi:hypothetical protein